MTHHTDQERVEFEAWANKKGLDLTEWGLGYRNDSVELLLEAWQAARASEVPEGWKLVPVELLERIQESLGSFVSDQGWSQSDMDTADALGGLLAAATQPPAQEGWCDGCSPDNCCGCGPSQARKAMP